MRLTNRFRDILKRINIFVVVFVAFINACFYCPIHSLAADSVSPITPYLRIYVGNTAVVDYGVPISPYPDVSFQVVKTSSSFRVSSSSGSASTGNNTNYYTADSYKTQEFATFQGSLRFGVYFWRTGDLASLFDSNNYINFSTLNVYIPFRLSSTFSTGESGSSSDESEHLLDGVFDLPTVITLPNGGTITPSLIKLSTSYYVLEVTLVDVSYRSGSIIYIDCPYTCSSVSDVGSYFYDNLDISVTPAFTVGSDGMIRYTTGTAYSGDSVNDKLGDNVQSLVDGYDSSSGNQVASDFESGASSYDQAEDNLFNSADSALTGFKFFDFSTFGTITTGLSFVSGIMTSIYNNFGAMQGLGIVLSVLFSVMFMAIVIGFYRYFK